MSGTLPPPSQEAQYLLALLSNLDVPGALLGGAADYRVTNLHRLPTSFTSATMAVNSLYTLTTKDTSPKAYIAPRPPVKNLLYAHKYKKLLVIGIVL